jgi:autoinducer-2 kinase
MSSHLLAIDAGTGSCRAVVFDRDLRQVGVAAREWVHREPPGVPGGQDFDVPTNWRLICVCIRDVLATAGLTGADIAAVSPTSMREGIVLYDEGGAEIWACPNVDSRAVKEAEDLVRSGDAARIYRIAGDWVSITSPARLRWLAANQPDVLRRAAALGLLSDWITYRLSGAVTTDPSCGSSSGLFELSARTWSAEVAEICGLPSHVLPPVYEPGTPIGTVSSPAAAQTGLVAGTPVVTGGADTQLALAGAGIGRDQFTVVAGTFWQTTVVLDSPVVDPGQRLRTLCHVVPGEWMLEGIGFYSGMAMRWLRDAFCSHEVERAAQRGVDPYVVMEEAAQAIPPGANGVVAVLSNVMNARRWVHASPAFVGFDLGDPAGTGIAAAIRAVEEAGAYVARAHRDLITEITGRPFAEAVFTGGASKGFLWPQIMADVLGVPVHVPVVTESSALGAAAAAGVGVGWFASLADVPGLGARARTLEPDPAAVAVYEQAYPAWQAIYRHQLASSEAGVTRPLWRAAGAGVD